MNKKFLSLVLALVMVLGTFGNVFAAAATDKKEEAKKDVPKLTSTDAKVQWLIDNKIVIGNADKDGKASGNMALNDPIRRDAVAKMLVYAIGEQDLAAKLQGVYRPFPDVALDNIMNGYISVGTSKASPANNLPFLIGYEDGKFYPTKEVTYAELAKMLVVLIDKDLNQAKHDANNKAWPNAWMQRAVQLGILDGLSVDNNNAKALRKDAFAMIYNAFYQLKNVKPVPANETRGIISQHSDGKTLVLNQGDYKVEYKVDSNTVFVNQEGKNQRWLGGRTIDKGYYVGSLVRVLADKDGVATHIIEMGNPEVGIANRATAWVDLGNKTLQVTSSTWNTKTNDVALEKDYFMINTAKYEVTDKTEFYVADYAAQQLTKVKDYDAAKKLVGKTTNNVYLAYEVLPASGIREAKVVVFNKVDHENEMKLFRVAKPVSNQTYKLAVQASGYTETAITEYDFRNVSNVWPYNYDLEAYDVVKLPTNVGRFTPNKDVVIDYSKANIYSVDKVLKVEGDKEQEVALSDANVIVLRDKNNFVQRYDLPKNRDAFFGKEVVKGAVVQIATREKADNVVEVISVLRNSEKLRGFLPKGQDSEVIKGELKRFTETKDGLTRVYIIKEGDKRESEFVTAIKNLKPLLDKKVQINVGKINKDYNVPEITKIELLADQTVLNVNDKAFLEAYTNLLNALLANKGVIEVGHKPLVNEVIYAFNNLTEAQKTAANKGQINTIIQEFNKISGLAEADKIAEIK